jgi:hypothetical protein
MKVMVSRQDTQLRSLIHGHYSSHSESFVFGRSKSINLYAEESTHRSDQGQHSRVRAQAHTLRSPVGTVIVKLLKTPFYIYEHYILQVSKEEYDTCRITNPNPRIIAICDKPYKLMYFTITFRSFTPQPGGLEFQPGQDYYFICK